MKKIVFRIVTLATVFIFMIVGCGKQDKEVSEDKQKQESIASKKEPIADDEDDESEEQMLQQIQQESNDLHVEERDNSDSEANNTTESGTNEDSVSNTAGNRKEQIKDSSINTPVVESHPIPPIASHEHVWEIETETYHLIETMTNGCNGCGLALYTITDSGTAHIEDLYYHEPYYMTGEDEPCIGGGFHSETYTRGLCYFCHGKVEFRQCGFTEMGKNCSKNETLGTYEKVYFDQNHFMYYNSCDCGMNWLMVDGVTGEGLVKIKEYCTVCGEEK